MCWRCTNCSDTACETYMCAHEPSGLMSDTTSRCPAQVAGNEVTGAQSSSDEATRVGQASLSDMSAATG